LAWRPERIMEQIWAPWRLAYVAQAKSASSHDECFICKGLAEADDRNNLIALRGSRSVVFLNRFPYNNGHLLVAPLAHKADLRSLDDAENIEIQLTLSRLIDVFQDLMHPEGYNIGLNLGRVAGAGVPGHVHWHLVPRWNGDTNFMSVLGDV